jgi:hypothetical protein
MRTIPNILDSLNFLEMTDACMHHDAYTNVFLDSVSCLGDQNACVRIKGAMEKVCLTGANNLRHLDSFMTSNNGNKAHVLLPQLVNVVLQAFNKDHQELRRCSGRTAGAPHPYEQH